MTSLLIGTFAIKKCGGISGEGYVGGDAPIGIIMDSGVPVAKRVLLISSESRQIVATTISDPVTGVYRFDKLNVDQEFYVVMVEINRTQQDQIKGRIRPKPY